MTTHCIDRLSEYHDGELSAADHAACQAHLTECDECRAVLRELQSVMTAARADVDRDPITDLWPGILARLEPRRVDAHSKPPAPLPFRPRTISFTFPQLALAASLLIAVSAGVSYVAFGRASNRSLDSAQSRSAAQEVPIQAMAESLLPPSSANVAPANFADAQFDQAVADLEQILLEQRENLDPRTVVIIERNLATINEAIRQARAALDADPANTFLNSHLADARRRKLDLLRRATSLSSGAGD